VGRCSLCASAQKGSVMGISRNSSKPLSAAALAVIWINFLFVDWAGNALPYVPISGEAVNTVLVLLLLVAVGVAIGVVGSFLSVTRFLRKI